MVSTGGHSIGIDLIAEYKVFDCISHFGNLCGKLIRLLGKNRGTYTSAQPRYDEPDIQWQHRSIPHVPCDSIRQNLGLFVIRRAVLASAYVESDSTRHLLGSV